MPSRHSYYSRAIIWFCAIQGLTEHLLQKQLTNPDEVIEKLFCEISVLEDFPKVIPLDLQLEETAIHLWNWAVTKRVGTAINEHQKAKVRHVACRLLFSSEPENPTEGAVRKQILMASKTGRTWLDCKNTQLADDFLGLAVKSLEKLYSRLTSRGDAGTDINTSKGDVEKDLLRVLSYQAESVTGGVPNKVTAECIISTLAWKGVINPSLPPQKTGYLSLVCYNFGVDSYNQKKYEQSSFWLSQSYDIGKINMKYSPGAESLIQAKVLRLLATVYLDWDCQQLMEKALSAVSLANKQCLHPSGLYLKIRILLRGGALEDHITAGEWDFNRLLPLSASFKGLRGDFKSFDFLKRVCQHFESSPELSSALVLHIELLLQRGQELLGKQKIEDVICCDVSRVPLQAESFSEALQWYSYSLSFYKAGQMEPNLAKLQRNRASCFLRLQQLDKAKEAIKEAKRCDPNSIFTQFSVFKIAILEGNVELVIVVGFFLAAVMTRMTILEGNRPTIIMFVLCFCNLLQNKQQDIAMKALESVCDHSTDDAQVLTAVRSVSTHSVTRRLTVHAPFVSYGSVLSQFCPRDRGVLMFQKTCLLMAAAASLECGRTSSHSDQVCLHLTQTLEHIQLCWEVWKTLRESGDFAGDPTDTLLLLYEFEARAKLNDPRVETVLDSVLELGAVEAKVLETVAALAMEPPAHLPRLCKKALRIALSLHRRQMQPDVTRCSQCLRSLIQLSLPSGVSEVEAPVLDEVWLCSFSSSAPQPEEFPETEVLWLLTRAWNMGIQLYSLAHYPEAERWCGLGMSFLQHLGSLQEAYQTQMSGLYSEVLDRLDKARRNLHSCQLCCWLAVGLPVLVGVK
uniref:Protein ZIP4 homolog n=1 Tax=Esox lucius TaxID=8010 RepID=A0AAY5KIB1_ESOLU